MLILGLRARIINFVTNSYEYRKNVVNIVYTSKQRHDYSYHFGLFRKEVVVSDLCRNCFDTFRNQVVKALNLRYIKASFHSWVELTRISCRKMIA